MLILSAKGRGGRVLGQMGADDSYITKPFSVRELICGSVSPSKEAAGRSTGTGASDVFLQRTLIDFDKYEVTVKGRKIRLSPIEIKLLFFFTKNRGRFIARSASRSSLG